MDGTPIGGEVTALGFPLGIGTEFGAWKVPFLRRAIVAARTSRHGVEEIWLDCYPNGGFSGGPVADMREPGEPRIIGIVVEGRDDPAHPEPAAVTLAHHISHVTDLIEADGGL